MVGGLNGAQVAWPGGWALRGLFSRRASVRRSQRPDFWVVLAAAEGSRFAEVHVGHAVLHVDDFTVGKDHPRGGGRQARHLV